MNELNKLLLSVILIAAGFMGASLLGPPELDDRVDSWGSSWGGPSIDVSQGLQPMSPGMLAARSQVDSAASEVPSPAPRTFEPPGDGSAWPLVSAPSSTPLAHRTAKHDPELQLAQSEASGAPNVAPLSAPAWGSWSSPATTPAPVEPRTLATETTSAWGTPPELSSPVPNPSSSWAAATPASGPLLFTAEQQRPLPGPAPVERVESRGAQEERSHVVTDGDTLPKLADRYLGDATRAQDLYDMNRDRLESPDLLPIGVMLRVPVEAHRSAPRADPKPFDPWQGAPTAASPFRNASTTSPEPLRKGLIRESRLAPIGGPTEREPAQPPAVDHFRDWSW